MHLNSLDNSLLGTNLGDRLYGHEGNDELNSGSGDDVLTGGIGNDMLNGGAGRDTYAFSLGDGNDRIIDVAEAGIGGRMLFGPGITRDDLTFTLDGTTLTIAYGNQGDTVVIENFDPAGINGSPVIDTFEFSDGFVASWQELTNQTPEIGGLLAGQVAVQGQAFSYTLPEDAFIDPDGDGLQYVAMISGTDKQPDWLMFDPLTHTFSGTPANGDVGSITVTVGATDTLSGMVGQSFTIDIANINDAPELLVPLSGQTATEDQPFSFTVPAGTFRDIDAGDSLTLSATLADGSALPEWLSFDPATATFSGTPGNGQVGELQLSVTAADQSGATVSSGFSLNITNVNDAPELLVPLSGQTATEDQPFSFTIPAGTFHDIDDEDSLTLSATLADGSYLPSWLTFDPATGTFSGIPGNDQVGALELSVTATDQSGAAASGSFLLNVSESSSGNSAPTATPDVVSISEGTCPPFVTGNLLANDSDPDGDTITVVNPGFRQGEYGYIGISADGRYGYMLNNQSRDVQSLGRDTQVTERFDYQISDGTEQSASSLEITINGKNDAPIVARQLADQQIKNNKAFSFALPAESFKDIDQGDTLTYSATLANGKSLPSWLKFNAETGTFSGTAPKNAGAIDIRVTATDKVAATGNTEGSLSVSDTFQLSFGKGNSSKPHCDDDYDQHDQQHQNRPKHHSKNQDDDLDDRHDHHRHDQDDRHDDHHKPLPKLPVRYLDAEQLDRYLSDLDEASSHSSHDGHALAARWQHVSRALSRDLAELGSEYGKSHKLGAETGGFHRDLAGTLGSTHAFGMNTLLAAGSSGTDLKGFKGLEEGMRRI